MKQNLNKNYYRAGNYITCLLKITTKTGETMDVVEVFLVDDNGKVKNIWAL